MQRLENVKRCCLAAGLLAAVLWSAPVPARAADPAATIEPTLQESQSREMLQLKTRQQAELRALQKRHQEEQQALLRKFREARQDGLKDKQQARELMHLERQDEKAKKEKKSKKGGKGEAETTTGQ